MKNASSILLIKKNADIVKQFDLSLTNHMKFKLGKHSISCKCKIQILADENNSKSSKLSSEIIFLNNLGLKQVNILIFLKYF